MDYSRVIDKKAIDKALKVHPDAVYKTVRYIHSDDMVTVGIGYLLPFTNLQRVYNLVLRVRERDMDKLRRISHVRGLCVDVCGTKSSKRCLERLKQIYDEDLGMHFLKTRTRIR